MIKLIFISTLFAVIGAQHGGEDHHKEDHYVDYHGHPVYKYNYYVYDSKTNDHKKQYEERDGDVIKGFYSVVQPDHKVRNVHYTADKDGFHTKITYDDGDKLASGNDGAFNIDKTHGGSEINNHVKGSYTYKEIKHEPKPQLIKYEPIQIKYEPVHQQQIKYEPVQHQQIKYEPVHHQQIKYEPVHSQEIKYIAPKIELKKEEPKKQSIGFEVSHGNNHEIKYDSFSGFEGFGNYKTQEKLGGFAGFGGFDSFNTFQGFDGYKIEENTEFKKDELKHKYDFNVKYSKPIIKEAEPKSDNFEDFNGYEPFSSPGFGLGYFNNNDKVGLGAFS